MQCTIAELACALLMGLQAKADAARDYGSSRPGDTSILFHLLRASNKETGKPFSELEIMVRDAGCISASSTSYTQG